MHTEIEYGHRDQGRSLDQVVGGHQYKRPYLNKP